ncbi:hypothetical protein HYU13_06540 [Candidatus Woesearchaeota archaeon]|nr:hypothetical protein [Candidatus Woesearchaeota archaeon]
MAETRIPDIALLIKDAPDYVPNLDKGFEVLTALAKAQFEECTALLRRGGQEVASYLKKNGIPEVEVTRLGESDAKVGGISMKVIHEDVYVYSQEKDVHRRAEELTSQFNWNEFEKVRELKKTGRELRWAFEDYVNAALELELTKVTPLNETNPEYPDVHFFVVKPNIVYEAHADFDEPYFVGMESKSLRPEMFADESFMRDFKRESTGVEANAYFARNPSTNVPGTYLMFNVVSNVLTDLRESRHQAAVEKEGKMTAGQKMVFAMKTMLGMGDRD